MTFVPEFQFKAHENYNEGQIVLTDYRVKYTEL